MECGLSDISNDVERRAAFLRQLRFLFYDVQSQAKAHAKINGKIENSTPVKS